MNLSKDKPPIRLLIAEDSRTQLELLKFIIETSGDFDLIGTAQDGIAAVEKVTALRPDIVLMDCNMPRANGFEAARRIMELCPVPIVMISSASSEAEAVYSFEAIKVGALAFLSKPSGLDTEEDAERQKLLVDTLRLMAEVKVVRRYAPGIRKEERPDHTGQRKPKLFAIAGSTGAPGILADILAAASPPPAPVLIVQHMAAGFIEGFAKWMQGVARFPVKVAVHGEMALKGTAYFAPDNQHLGISQSGELLLDNGPREEGFRPSADFLFRSVANAFGADAMAILLSGMGKDGADGMKKLRDAGGCTVIQDEASAVIFGMPGAALALGAVQHVLPPEDIAKFMVSGVAATERARHG